MTPLLRAEVRKVLASPSSWWLLLAVVATGIVGTLAPLLAGGDRRPGMSDHAIQEALHGAAAGAVLVVVAGVIGLAGEWRHGQATQTFLTEPRRRRVLAVKGLTYMGVGGVYGAAAGAAATVTAWAWYRAEGARLPLDRSAVWLTLLGCLVVSVAFGLLGVAIGGVARNQVAAVIGVLAYQAVVEPALFAASPTTFRWLPGMASFSIRRQPTEGLLSVGPASVVLLATVAGFLLAADRLVGRTDIAT